MAAERGRGRVREFELEGIGLFVVGGVLLVLLVAAFYVGRWYERRTAPVVSTPATSGVQPDPLANVESGDPVEAGEDATFFHTLGEGKEAEPQREARKAPPVEEVPAAAATGSAATAPPGGDHYVQVFAGRLRESAEKLVRELEGKGLPVRIVPVSDGQDRLFKVQVGGYPTRDAAQQIADRLKDDGYPTAFVTGG